MSFIIPTLRSAALVRSAAMLKKGSFFLVFKKGSFFLPTVAKCGTHLRQKLDELNHDLLSSQLFREFVEETLALLCFLRLQDSFLQLIKTLANLAKGLHF